MKTVIRRLLTLHQNGKLTRRDLLWGLTLLAGTLADADTSAQHDLKVTGVDHVSIYVRDLEQSAKFYTEVLGLSPVGQSQRTQTDRIVLGVGGKAKIALSRNQPPGLVDHFGLTVDGFNADEVTRQLRSRGVTPRNGDGVGFHLTDPDGLRIQLL